MSPTLISTPSSSSPSISGVFTTPLVPCRTETLHSHVTLAPIIFAGKETIHLLPRPPPVPGGEGCLKPPLGAAVVRAKFPQHISTTCAACQQPGLEAADISYGHTSLHIFHQHPDSSVRKTTLSSDYISSGTQLAPTQPQPLVIYISEVTAGLGAWPSLSLSHFSATPEPCIPSDTS